ncbi:conserved protein, unknown function [Hepatocystis sp. ex Piliocolobus tephrosceles]|nr:conserved protein, unknown function [Hepatocystis sp. ex Piliocolobus tephrosceles]
MNNIISWITCIVLGTTIPLGLATLSLYYLNVDKEKKTIHEYNNEYRKKQKENMQLEKKIRKDE